MKKFRKRNCWRQAFELTNYVFKTVGNVDIDDSDGGTSQVANTCYDKWKEILEKELFAGYDCSRCRNCCKMYRGSIPEEDLARDAEYLGLTKEQFIEKYLADRDGENRYQTQNAPCDFLDEDGNCRLGDCRPESCKKYPYTDQPDRWGSLYSVLDVIEVCPVAFEIYERLKKEYGWRFK